MQEQMQIRQPGEIFVDDNGRQLRVMRHGGLQDVATGKIVKGAQYPTITAANAHEMLALRRQKSLQAAIDGIIAGTKPKAKNLEGGLTTLFEAQARLAMDIDKGRASTEALRLLLQALGLFAKDIDAGGDTAHATLSLSREALMDLAQALLKARKQGDET